MRYYFGDLDSKLKLVAQAVEILKEFDTEGFVTGVSRFNVNEAMKACYRRHVKFYGLQSKYAPHQGEKEIARRARQIEARTLRFGR